MSHVAQHQVPVRQRLARDARRGRMVALAVVAFVAALLVALAVALGDNGGSGSRSAAEPLPQTGPFGGVRYDGGPEEGGLGTVPSHPLPGVRYDGGPEEGSRNFRQW
jgi:hypothetical protein